MTVVACYCGCTFGFDGQLGQCPYCGEISTLPRVSDAEAEQMRRELDLILNPPKEFHAQ